MCTLRRLALDQTPMTDELFVASVGFLPLAVRSVIGTWIAMLCTLTNRVLFTAGWALRPLSPGRLNVACRFSSGRTSSRSNVAPRST